MAEVLIDIPEDVLVEASAIAAEREVEVEVFLSKLVTGGIASMQGRTLLRRRARRGDVKAAIAILDSLPPAAPDDGDEMPTSGQT